MLRLLRRLVGAESKDEARLALADAHTSLDEAETQAVETKALAERVMAHGRKNHFGERIEQEMRRRYAH